jgi:glycosyltransferase involved in cell wall biosynthesis
VEEEQKGNIKNTEKSVGLGNKPNKFDTRKMHPRIKQDFNKVKPNITQRDNVKSTVQPQQPIPKNEIKDRGFDKNPEKKSDQLNPRFQNSKEAILSIVIPLFNEEESLPELTIQLENELRRINNNRYEVIFVDDGSTDNSWNVIKQIHSRNPRFRGIRFRRNFGKSAALSAGFSKSRGAVIITMDADLQDDPSEIPAMISKLKEGYDLVSGWKKKRHDPITKTIPSRFFNFVTSLTSGVKLHDHNCGLKAYRRDVVKSLQVYGEMHRYLPALANWQGFKVTEIPVKHHSRRYGKTKFGFSRFIKGYLDLLTVLFTTRYFKRPLHFFGTFGTIFTLIGFALDAYLTVEWVMKKTALSNRPLALLGIALIIVGVQFISMGLIGELVIKNSDRNDYSIKEII